MIVAIQVLPVPTGHTRGYCDQGVCRIDWDCSRKWETKYRPKADEVNGRATRNLAVGQAQFLANTPQSTISLGEYDAIIE
jgi:hypothetical protein